MQKYQKMPSYLMYWNFNLKNSSGLALGLFICDKYIYVTPADHQSAHKILVESKYVPVVKFTEMQTS